MEKEIINIGHTNKLKYREGDTFVLHKTNTGFNHKIDYSVLSEFDFVPKLISEDDDKLVWEWIEGEQLKNPTNEDIVELGRIIRALHKSDAKFPKNNVRRRLQSYVNEINAKELKVDSINNYWRECTKLISLMGKLNPVHNDLWYQNIIKDANGKLWIVDWEYATMGDKHFDLAFLLTSYNFNEDQEEIFLNSYNSYDDYNAYIDEWMMPYKRFVIWFTIVWAHAQPVMPFDLTPLENFLKTKY